MYDFRCEHCDGIVRERRVPREALRHKGNFVILEDVPIGVCDTCGTRYYDASILRRVAEIGRGASPAARTVAVPVDQYAPAVAPLPLSFCEWQRMLGVQMLLAHYVRAIAEPDTLEE